MINKLKILFPTNLVQPMPMHDDIFLRNEIAHKSSLTPTEDSMDFSCQSVEAPNPPANSLYELTQGKSGKNKNLMRVFIPDGLDPGQAVNIRYPSGKKMRASIPPEAQWRSSSKHPGQFFLVPVDEKMSKRGSTKEEHRCCSAKPSKNVAFPGISHASVKSCECVLSLGVYDSYCPVHGTQ